MAAAGGPFVGLLLVQLMTYVLLQLQCTSVPNFSKSGQYSAELFAKFSRCRRPPKWTVIFECRETREEALKVRRYF